MEGDENSVTMVDVLKEQEAFEEDAEAVLGASDDKNCTYPLGYIKRQALYACLTCCPESVDDPSLRSGVCLACSLACHEKHTFIELYTKRNFRCDCGGPKFKSKPCSFGGQKSEPNTQNQYNQNFSGLYCVCHRPYPDPDATESEDEMIQCIVCEDWLHSQHLDSKLPPPDQYSEMICQTCMANNDFLDDYLCYAVSKADNDISVELNVTDDAVENATDKLIEQPEKIQDINPTVKVADVNMTEEVADINPAEQVADIVNSAEKVADFIDPAENPQSSTDNVSVSNNEISTAKDQIESDTEMVSVPIGDNTECSATLPIGNSGSEPVAKDGNLSETPIHSSESEINDVLTIKPTEVDESMEIDTIDAITAENVHVITQKVNENINPDDHSENLQIQNSENKVLEVNKKSEIDTETPVAMDSSADQNPAGEIREQCVEMLKNNEECATPKDIDNITKTEIATEKDIHNITSEENSDNITGTEFTTEKYYENVPTARNSNDITETELTTEKDVDNIATAKSSNDITETEFVIEQDIDDVTTEKNSNDIAETEFATEKGIDVAAAKSSNNITETEFVTEKDIDDVTTVKISNDIAETEFATEKNIDDVTTVKISNDIAETEFATEKDIDDVETVKSSNNITETEFTTEKVINDLGTANSSNDITETEFATEKDIDYVETVKSSNNITETEFTTDNNITETEFTTDNNITETEFATEKDIDYVETVKSSNNITETEFTTDNNITTEKNGDNITETINPTEKASDVTDIKTITEKEEKNIIEPEIASEKDNTIITDIIITPEKDISDIAKPEIATENNTGVTDKHIENNTGVTGKHIENEIDIDNKITNESNFNIDVEPEINSVIDSKTVSELLNNFGNGQIVDDELKENLNIHQICLKASNPVVGLESGQSEILLTTQVPNSNDTKSCENAESDVVMSDAEESPKEASADNCGKDNVDQQSKMSEPSDVATSEPSDATASLLISAGTEVISNSVSETVELMETCETPSEGNKASEAVCDKTEKPLTSNETLEQKSDVNESDTVESISEDTQMESAIEKSITGDIGVCPNPESQLSATHQVSGLKPDSNEQPVDFVQNEKISEIVTKNSVKDTDPKMNKSETACERKDKKRKLEHQPEHVTIKGIVKKIKREVMDCIRPATCLRPKHKGAAFWPSDWRSKLCSCPSCLDMYSERKVSFLIDVEDTITAYEDLGKIKTETSSSQYEKGMDALSSLGHVQQINAITEYNRMKEKLLEFLKTFKDKKEVVKEEDIKGFFAGMKPKREPDGVYFCQ